MTVPYQASATMSETIPVLIKCFETTVAPSSSVRFWLGHGGCDRDWLFVSSGKFVGSMQAALSEAEATLKQQSTSAGYVVRTLEVCATSSVFNCCLLLFDHAEEAHEVKINAYCRSDRWNGKC